MKQKLDELLASFDMFKQAQQDNQSAMTKKLKQLERDMHIGTAECTAKKLKCDQGFEFQKKGNEHQFQFNDRIKDRLGSVSSLVNQVKLANQQDTTILKEAAEEIQ